MILSLNIFVISISVIIMTTAARDSYAQNTALPSTTLCYENQDYTPYLTGTSETSPLKNPGVLVELSRLAFEKANLQVSFIRRPWKRCLRMVQEGRVAGMFGVIYVKEREKIGRYPMVDGKPDHNRRLMQVDYPIFTANVSKIKWNGKQFASTDIRLGTPLGYATVKSLKKDHHIIPIVSYLPNEGLTHVADGSLDGYVVEKYVGQSIVKKQHLHQSISQLAIPYKTHDLHLLLSHKFYNSQKNKAEKIWSELASLREMMLDGLMKKYLQAK